MVFRCDRVVDIGKSQAAFLFSNESLIDVADRIQNEVKGGVLQFSLTGEAPNVHVELACSFGAAGHLKYVSKRQYTGRLPSDSFCRSLALGELSLEDLRVFLESREVVPRETVYVSRVDLAKNRLITCETKNSLFVLETLEADLRAAKSALSSSAWSEVPTSGAYKYCTTAPEVVEYVRDFLRDSH